MVGKDQGVSYCPIPALPCGFERVGHVEFGSLNIGDVIEYRHDDNGNDDRKVRQEMSNFSRQISTAFKVLQSDADKESTSK